MGQDWLKASLPLPHWRQQWVAAATFLLFFPPWLFFTLQISKKGEPPGEVGQEDESGSLECLRRHSRTFLSSMQFLISSPGCHLKVGMIWKIRAGAVASGGRRLRQWSDLGPLQITCYLLLICGFISWPAHSAVALPCQNTFLLDRGTVSLSSQLSPLPPNCPHLDNITHVPQLYF